MTYERAAILQWLKTQDTSPMTGAKLASKVLVPNLVLRRCSNARLTADHAYTIQLF